MTITYYIIFVFTIVKHLSLKKCLNWGPVGVQICQNIIKYNTVIIINTYLVIKCCLFICNNWLLKLFTLVT